MLATFQEWFGPEFAPPTARVLRMVGELDSGIRSPEGIMHRNQLKLVLMGLALAGSLQLTHAIPLPAAHGYLGVGLADASQGAPSAARVGELDPQGPAAQAGLRSGDLI